MEWCNASLLPVRTALMGLCSSFPLPLSFEAPSPLRSSQRLLSTSIEMEKESAPTPSVQTVAPATATGTEQQSVTAPPSTSASLEFNWNDGSQYQFPSNWSIPPIQQPQYPPAQAQYAYDQQSQYNTARQQPSYPAGHGPAYSYPPPAYPSAPLEGATYNQQSGYNLPPPYAQQQQPYVQPLTVTYTVSQPPPPAQVMSHAQDSEAARANRSHTNQQSDTRAQTISHGDVQMSLNSSTWSKAGTVASTQPVSSNDSTGHVPPPRLQPTSVASIRAAHLSTTSWPQLQTDQHGRLEVKTRPDCMMKCFMIPFPFLCIGCCMSESSNLVFDDRKQQVSVNSYSGYCWCCGQGRDIRYDEIANVVAKSSNMRINNRPAYSVCFLLRSGDTVRIRGAALMEDIEPTLFSIHRFLFGRGDPQAYQPPSVYSILMR